MNDVNCDHHCLSHPHSIGMGPHATDRTMGISKQRAAENRQAIIAAAQALFRERGVDGVGLAELMKTAGFTQGGFYNHFKSKDDLVQAVLDEAMHTGSATLEAAI